MISKSDAWRRYYEKNKVRLNQAKRAYHKKRYANKSAEIKKKMSERRRVAKVMVLSHYSHAGIPKCVRCGFEDIRALCLDHTKNNGSEDRKKTMGKNVGGSGSRFYFYLIKHGLPSGYQTLCANCNLIKEIRRKTVARGY